MAVDVIGTKFEIAEAGSEVEPRVRVSVEHGIVLVRGETVPSHLQRLVDGQSIEVAEFPPAPSVAPEPASSAVLEHSTASRAPRPSARTEAPWRTLARGGDYDGAYRQLGAAGVAAEAERASADDLLALADVARLSAHPGDAIGPLSRVIQDHPTDPRASLAAFTLGRLELDTLARPSDAAQAFRRAIDLGLPSSLAPDAYGRLVEAETKAGDDSAAASAREEYWKRYPRGDGSAPMDRWLRGD